MQKSEAATILGVKENHVKYFKEKDPYNPWELEGYISISEHLYGSMIIFKIDNYLTEQVVVGTPKQKYPFDRLGRFKFPSAKRINVYEKYDGTNILAYGYKLKGKYWVTFKTRLNPVLGESSWGNWVKMWGLILEKYPKLLEFATEQVEYGLNPSFELYGLKNKHLIEYKVPLDAAFLFSIKNDIENPQIMDPADVYWHGRWELHVARLEASIDSSTDLYSWYQKLRNQQESMNEFTEDGFIKGSEGFVWYLKDLNEKMYQYKNKPESIENIHWAASGMSKNSVTTTVINAYEMSGEVTYETVKELLLEEYTERDIEARKDIVLKAMVDVKERIVFRDKVLNLYNQLELDLKENKSETMRSLSPFFSKKEMRRVFNLLDAEYK